jgi:hypothetical protein
MKKISILLLLALVCSCSKSDDNSNSSNSDFHPPAWIQGNWEQQSSISAGVLFSFSVNDFCMTNMGIAKQCQQEFVDMYRKFGNAVTVTETITTTTYTAEIKYLGGQSVIYSFRKLSNNSIEWTAVAGSVLIKQ